MLAAACAPDSSPAGDASVDGAASVRSGRFGSLRDLVLIERRSAVPGDGERSTYFFLDRFETTRADWAEFAATPDGQAVDAADASLGGDPVLPVGRVDLRQARAFAHWRFARLPQLDEWLWATVGDGRNRFPWGSKEDATRTNTGELGLGEPTPVGTFESGRRAEGWPYDLIGNVSEWTESVPWTWCVASSKARAALSAPSGAAVGWLQRRVMRVPALAVWQAPGGVMPLMCAVVLGGEDVPREVAGADFLTPMSVQAEAVLAGDRRLRTGVRLATTAPELLCALLATSFEPTAVDYERLRRFEMRDRHREVLRAAWLEVGAAATREKLARPLGRWLVEHLGAPPARH